MVPATTLTVTPGETLTIYVGSPGGNSGDATAGTGGSGFGFASGGNGGTGGSGGSGGGSRTQGGGGGGGGGASAVVRVSSGTPLVVAAGGGGGGGIGDALITPTGGAGGNANSSGSAGGGPSGGAAGSCCSASARSGGQGGSSATNLAAGGGGGGGGGYDGGTNGGGIGGSAGVDGIATNGTGGGGGAGGRSWRNNARYTPTSFNSTGGGQVQLTFPTPTTTTLSSSANPSVQGEPVTFTATVTPQGAFTGTLTGTVGFLDGGVLLGTGTLDASGVATFTTSALSPGSHTITAEYAGSTGPTGFASSLSDPITQVVTALTPGMRLVASADPVAVGAAGQTIAYSFTVTNTGNVTVDDLGIADSPTSPAGPVGSITCAPGTIGPGDVSNCTGTYAVSGADMAAGSGEILHTFTATGTAAGIGGDVDSNPFSVAVDVRAPRPGWNAIVVNTTNTVGLTP